MKKVLSRLLASLSLAALPAAAYAADSLVDTTTLLRFSQDSRPGVAKSTLLPATVFLGLDADKLADGKLSAHVLGWGRADLADKSFNENQVDGSLTYGYLQYRFGAANAQARAGRFFVHEGILNEQVDGVSVRSDLPYGFGVSAFGGATVHNVRIPGTSSDGKGDGIFGGRVNYRYGGMFEIGLAGVYETVAPTMADPNLAGRFGSHRVIGADLWYSPFAKVALMARASINTETSRWAEQGYLLTVKPLKDLTVTGEFNDYQDRDLFYSSALFAAMPSMLSGNNLNQQSRTFGGSASYQLNPKFELTGDYKHYTREIGKADRLGAELRCTLSDLAVRTGAGYHYLRSSADFAVLPTLDASGSFHELRAWAMRDTKSYFASLDVIDYLFKREIDGKKNALELYGSLGYHLTPNLALSGDLSYGSNPQNTDELKGLIRLNYSMKLAGKGDTK
ncbi:hypothetical protein GMLC_31220 [Geomonas limicola]|uniref:Outer membrane channel protein n=1 Tax=Geomonas limicola TaxID=2740186 RepID=A0A6V8NDB8_9BACT|nr:hypothetical protein [Geomonas limicola]GFO69543.1 hypothetical protein GMLC_31220 [Geomonas limicola]